MSTRTRRIPAWLLVVTFVVAPIVEVYTIVQVGSVIGPWWTILLLIASGVVGSWLVRREGGRAWRAFSTALAEGRMPHREIADGILILLGGALMITPGFISDVLGVVMILPLTRPLGRRLLAGFISGRLATGPYAAGGRGPTGGPYGPPGPAGPRRRPGDDDVVTGEVVDR